MTNQEIEVTSIRLVYKNIFIYTITHTSHTSHTSHTLLSGHAALAKGKGWVLPSLMGGSKKRRERLGMAGGGDGLATAYCAGFSDDVKKCTCPILGSHIEVINVAAGSTHAQTTEGGSGGLESITLITAAWAQEYYSKALDPMLGAYINKHAYRGGLTHTHKLSRCLMHICFSLFFFRYVIFRFMDSRSQNRGFGSNGCRSRLSCLDSQVNMTHRHAYYTNRTHTQITHTFKHKSHTHSDKMSLY